MGTLPGQTGGVYHFWAPAIAVEPLHHITRRLAGFAGPFDRLRLLMQVELVEIARLA